MISSTLSITTIMTVTDSELNFIEQLLSGGYEYNPHHHCYERVWTTNDGKESITELYLKDSNSDDWLHKMIGYEGSIFYQERVTHV